MGTKNVRFWPKSRHRVALQMSAFGGKADMTPMANDVGSEY
jgi:hypothetical protein